MFQSRHRAERRRTLHPVPYVANELFGRLAGCRLLSVQFVLDYVQLHFDSEEHPEQPLLTCEVLPAVETAGALVRSGGPGWADALLALIGRTVSATGEGSGGLRIEFADSAVVLDPTPDELGGPEIALLSGFADRRWMVWRPGEGAFEHLGW